MVTTSISRTCQPILPRNASKRNGAIVKKYRTPVVGWRFYVYHFLSIVLQGLSFHFLSPAAASRDMWWCFWSTRRILPVESYCKRIMSSKPIPNTRCGRSQRTVREGNFIDVKSALWTTRIYSVASTEYPAAPSLSHASISKSIKFIQKRKLQFSGLLHVGREGLGSSSGRPLWAEKAYVNTTSHTEWLGCRLYSGQFRTLGEDMAWGSVFARSL